MLLAVGVIGKRSFPLRLSLFTGIMKLGKVPFFHLMGGISFYGWRPVTNNPYLPWDGTRAAFNAELLNEKGNYFRCREVRQSATGKVIKMELVVICVIEH